MTPSDEHKPAVDSRWAVLFLIALLAFNANAAPLLPPGHLQLRNDLQLLNDSGVTDIPLSAWPISNGDIAAALALSTDHVATPGIGAALQRLRNLLRVEMASSDPLVQYRLAGSYNGRSVRSFENTPRDEGELGAHLSWMGDRFAINLAATAVANPFDGDEFRPDGTYVGLAIGNWMITAGWQERWWGPGRDGSLILSTNARPTPGIAIQRIVSTPFESKWLSWTGPWALTSFMSELDDERTIRNALLFGIRGTFRPPNTGLEIGISRSAQWCGDKRPCNLSTFGDLLVGNDNGGVNVAIGQEPGNQLGGFDVRWRLPHRIPAALYMQWIGEDGRSGGGAIGLWLRQIGAEHWGMIGKLSHRSHFEVSDSMCREGGFGFSNMKPNCAYGHAIYQTGYRYQGRSIGHSGDGDTLSYSFGSTLVQSAGHLWNVSLRYMEINRKGSPNSRHTLTPTPLEQIDLQISHERQLRYGQLHAGAGYSILDDLVSNTSYSDITAFIQWSSR